MSRLTPPLEHDLLLRSVFASRLHRLPVLGAQASFKASVRRQAQKADIAKLGEEPKPTPPMSGGGTPLDNTSSLPFLISRCPKDNRMYHWE